MTMASDDVVSIRTVDDVERARSSVQALLRSLTVDAAVQIALLNNRGLRAAYNELALAEAEFVGERLPPNPTFAISRITGNGGYEIERQVVGDILALATLPFRSEIARQRFQKAQLRAAQETLRLAAEVRRTYNRCARHEATETLALTQNEPDAVPIVSLDSLAAEGLIDATMPVVIKLDVEGMEIEALTGAEGLMQRDCVVICEEHGFDRMHGITRHLINELSLRVFVFDPVRCRFIRLDGIERLDRLKKHAWVGYNVFAISSPLWEQRLLSATSKHRRRDRRAWRQHSFQASKKIARRLVRNS